MDSGNFLYYQYLPTYLFYFQSVIFFKIIIFFFHRFIIHRLYVCAEIGCYATAKQTTNGNVILMKPHTHLTANRCVEGDNINAYLIETLAFKAALKAKVNSGHGRLIDIYRSEAIR